MLRDCKHHAWKRRSLQCYTFAAAKMLAVAAQSVQKSILFWTFQRSRLDLSKNISNNEILVKSLNIFRHWRKENDRHANYRICPRKYTKSLDVPLEKLKDCYKIFHEKATV